MLGCRIEQYIYSHWMMMVMTKAMVTMGRGTGGCGLWEGGSWGGEDLGCQGWGLGIWGGGGGG